MKLLAIIKRIACLLCRSGGQVQQYLPTSTKTITFNELHKLLRAQFPDANIYLSDRTYKLCSLADIHYFLKRDKTNRYEYEAEYLDCDDFAYRLMGQFSIPEWSALAFGICWTNKHALNCLVSSAKKFWFVEPQQDTVQEELRVWQGTTVRLILM